MLKRWSLNEAEPPPPRDVRIAFRNQRISTCIIPIYKMVSLSFLLDIGTHIPPLTQKHSQVHRKEKVTGRYSLL